MTPPSLSTTVESGDGWTLHLGNCIAGMRELADKSVDVTITDPPYDEHTHSAGRSGSADRLRVASRGQREKNPSNRATFNRVRTLGFDALTASAMTDAAREFARLTKRWVLVFCSVEMIGDWRRELIAAGLEYVRTCFWHKLGSTPQFTGDRPGVAVEAIVVAHPRGRKRWNGGGMHGLFAHAIVLDRNNLAIRCHTTQKPIALMDELIALFSDEEETVLDAFAGSGTTLLAATRGARRAIGFEISAEYHAIACRRLRGEAGRLNPSQPSLLDWARP